MGEDYAGLADAVDEIAEATPKKQARLDAMTEAESRG